MNLKGFNVKKCNLADRTGLEPATSAVTGQHSNQLNYRSKKVGVTNLFPLFEGTAKIKVLTLWQKLF